MTTTRSCISSTPPRARKLSPPPSRSSRRWRRSTAPPKLAYAIDYKTEGHYVLMSFTSDPDFPKELDRVMGITDGILRSMIVCKGE